MIFVTFNLRCDYRQDRENCFVYRQPLILRAIGREKPDVICFQEVLPHMARWIKQNLTDYYAAGCGRGRNLDGEQMTIAFRKEKYQLLDMRTFWLSETPAVPGSRYPGQSPCPRTCTDAVLMEEESGRIFRVMNTHLDHTGKQARERGLDQILQRAEKPEIFPGIPTILAGDFNVEPDSEEMEILENHPGFTNATRHIGITYHGYGKANQAGQIDYIILSNGIQCNWITKWIDEEDGVYLSDHYPVCAEIMP